MSNPNASPRFLIARLLMGIAICASWSMPSSAEDARTLHFASTFPTSMPILNIVAETLPAQVSAMSEDRFQLVFHEPNDLVPATQTVVAVSQGKVEGAWAGAGWFASTDSAFNMFSSVPFGPGIAEYLAWMHEGGGLELAREMFHAQGVHNIPCGIIPPEASGWFTKEIESKEDLVGLKMRFFGLGALVMQKHGVITQQLAPGALFDALQSGEIDATEFSLPAIDMGLGLSKVTKYYYFPGWHQQATLFDLYINLDVWRELDKSQQAMIEVACGHATSQMIATAEGRQWSAMQALQAEGVIMKRWSPDLLVSFEDAWLDIVEEESSKNPNFARVYDSYATFRENYKIWKHFSFLQ